MCAWHTVSSVPFSLWSSAGKRADLLTLSYVVFACVFVTFLYMVSWARCGIFIVSIPDFCLLLLKNLGLHLPENLKESFLLIQSHRGFSTLYSISGHQG